MAASASGSADKSASARRFFTEKPLADYNDLASQPVSDMNRLADALAAIVDALISQCPNFHVPYYIDLIAIDHVTTSFIILENFQNLVQSKY